MYHLPIELLEWGGASTRKSYQTLREEGAIFVPGCVAVRCTTYFCGKNNLV